MRLDEQKSYQLRASVILAILGFLTHTRHSMKMYQLNEGSEGEPVKQYLKGRFLQFWEGQQTTLAEMPQVLRHSLGTARLTGQKTGKQSLEWNSGTSELVGPRPPPQILHSLGNKCKVSPLWEARPMHRPTLLSAPIPLGGQGRTLP